VLQDYIDAVITAEQRVARLTQRIMELMPTWSMAPVATVIQAMRGVALINAVTIVAEVGDFARFGNARQLMAYLGLVERFQSSNHMGCSKRPHPCDGKSKMQLCGFMESVV
jgi:transposase